jgi:hypothetical protein
MSHTKNSENGKLAEYIFLDGELKTLKLTKNLDKVGSTHRWLGVVLAHTDLLNIGEISNA